MLKIKLKSREVLIVFTTFSLFPISNSSDKIHVTAILNPEVESVTKNK